MSACLIEDRDAYVTSMKRSMVDKMFFAGVVSPAALVDYGCADGALLRAYDSMFPGSRLLGYDSCPNMVRRARVAAAGHRHLGFHSDWAEVEDWLGDREDRSGSAVLFSSVYHEMESYLSADDMDEQWSRVWGSCFDHVILRDMMLSRSVARPSDPLLVARIRQRYDAERLREWERYWGSIELNHSLTHFMLTYRYEANWDREMRENYVPVFVEDFIGSVPITYEIVHFEHYTLPFLRDRVREDFGVELTDRTHVKMMARKT